MTQYIDKSAIVAEIKRRIKECDKLASAAADNNLSNTLQANELLIRQYTSLLHFLDTIETKEINSTDAFIRKARKYFIKELPNFRSFMESGTAFIKNFESFIRGE